LAAKIVQGGVKMAGLHGVKLRQNFERTVPKLLATSGGGGPREERQASFTPRYKLSVLSNDLGMDSKC
jgi:hypothetical protein